MAANKIKGEYFKFSTLCIPNHHSRGARLAILEAPA